MVSGQVTACIYSMIRDRNILPAIKILEEKLASFPNSHAALSLLGYCHYMVGDFYASISKYELLLQLHPHAGKYNVYHAQALYKAGMHADAVQACLSIEGNQKRVQNLQSCIQLEKGDTTGSHAILEQCIEGNIDGAINIGCCMYKDKNYSGAHAKFIEAMNAMGFQVLYKSCVEA
ncbi:unnamed protein product [Calypogeia fissa]